MLFLGAGQAGVGIATLVVAALTADGLSLEEARRRCWFVDVNGLVVNSRHDLREDQRPYAHDHAWMPDLLSAVQALQPTALIGVSGQPHTFARPVIEAMSAVRDTPIIFALSNPTANAECTAEQAYAWSGGARDFRQRQSLSAGRVSGQDLRPQTSEQRLHLSRGGIGRHCVWRAPRHRRHVLRGRTDARQCCHPFGADTGQPVPTARQASRHFGVNCRGGLSGCVREEPGDRSQTRRPESLNRGPDVRPDVHELC